MEKTQQMTSGIYNHAPSGNKMKHFLIIYKVSIECFYLKK